jgi:hypothetical protein
LFLPPISDFFPFIMPVIIIYFTYTFFFKINSNKTFFVKNGTNINNIGCGVIYSYINIYLFIVLYNFFFVFILKGSNNII